MPTMAMPAYYGHAFYGYAYYGHAYYGYNLIPMAGDLRGHELDVRAVRDVMEAHRHALAVAAR